MFNEHKSKLQCQNDEFLQWTEPTEYEQIYMFGVYNLAMHSWFSIFVQKKKSLWNICINLHLSAFQPKFCKMVYVKTHTERHAWIEWKSVVDGVGCFGGKHTHRWENTNTSSAVNFRLFYVIDIPNDVNFLGGLNENFHKTIAIKW